MKIVLLLSLILMNELCLGMKEEEQGFGNIFFTENTPQSVTVITSDQKTIVIDPEIAQCMESLTNLENCNEEQTLTLIDSATLNVIIAILKEQKIKPSVDIIRNCKKNNEKLLIDYKSTVEQASEKLNKKETFEEAKTELEVPQELKTLLNTINDQGKLIKELNAFSFERNAVEKICQTLDFTQILLLIRATSILGIPFLDDALVTIAATKKVNITATMNDTVNFLDQKYINRILHQGLFTIKESLSMDIYPSRFFLEPITMRLTPKGKYFIYQSFESTGWLFKKTVPEIVFWDCKKKKKVQVITNKHIGTIYYSPNQKQFCLNYYDSNLERYTEVYDSDTLKTRSNSQNFLSPKAFIKTGAFIKKSIYIFDAENAHFPLEKTIFEPLFTGKQMETMFNSGGGIVLSEEQDKVLNEGKQGKLCFAFDFDPYERHNVNKKLLLSMTRNYITINSTEDFSCVKIIPALIGERKFHIEKAAFSPSGKHLAACGKIGFLTGSGTIWKPTLKVWKTSDWSCVGTIIDEKNALLREHANTFSALCFSPDDSMIAVSNLYKKEVYFCGPLNVPKVNLAQLNYCMYHTQEDGKVDVRLQKLYNTLPPSIKNNLATPPWDTSEIIKQDMEDIIERKVDNYKAELFGSKSTKLLLERAKSQKK